MLLGDFAEATRLQPIGWLLFPYLGGLAGREAVEYLKTGRTGRWSGHRVAQVVGAGLMALLVAVWVARWFGAFGGPVPIDGRSSLVGER